MGNVTIVSTDPQEVVERVLQVPKQEETLGGVADSAETAAESQTAQVESTEEDEHGESGKPSKRSQKIKRLAEKLLKAEQERDELRTKFEQQQGGRVEQPKEPAKQDPHAYPEPKPKATDFNDPQEFVEALTDWKAEEREYRNARKAEEQAAQDAHAELSARYNDRVAEAIGKYDDFQEVVGKSTVKLWPEVKQALQDHELGPDIVYYLAKNPEVAEKLGEMSPIRAVAELGHIANNLPAVGSSPETQKPRLINPVGGGSKRPDVPSATERSSLPFSEWKKLRQAGAIR